jgi:hypothetical protein
MSAPAAPAIAPAFDQLLAQVESGPGIVARFPGIVAVCGAAAPEKLGVLNRFLMICSEVSAAGARSPGRRLARQLAAWLAQLDDAPDLGTVSPTDGGLAIFLSGAGAVQLGDRGPTLTGRESAGWLDRIVDWPNALALTCGPAPALSFASSVLDLRQGVVPGYGLVLLPPRVVAAAPPESAPASPAAAVPAPAAAVPAPAAAAPAAAPPAVPPPAAPAPAPVAAAPGPPRPVPAPPLRSARIDGAQQQEPPRPPLPLPSVAGEPVVAPESDGHPKVQGFLCSRGHLNDPRGLFCGICGIRMAERTGILTIGRRPPLGLLVFDDGVTFTVDADYLLGREPDSDARVRQGLVRPLVVIDNSGAISRRHCEIRLDGWVPLLIDIGSANGTFVAARGVPTWSTLVPQRPMPLEAGTRIRLGNRTLVFESPHGAP